MMAPGRPKNDPNGALAASARDNGNGANRDKLRKNLRPFDDEHVALCPISFSGQGTLVNSVFVIVLFLMCGTVASADEKDTATVNYVAAQKNNLADWHSFSRINDVVGPTTDPTKTSPHRSANEALTIFAVGAQTAGASFSVRGAISGLSKAPTLQYQDNGGAWQNLPTGETGTRLWQNQPGGNGSAWNTPFGSGAIFGLATDADTLAISRCGANPGPCGIINSVNNYGQTYYVGKVTDGTYRFSSSNNGRSRWPDNGATLTATMHVPTGAIAPGPYPGDNAFVLVDPVNYPGRQYTWGGIQVRPPGLQRGQGPFMASAGEWDDATSDQFGHDYDTGLSGYQVGTGMINFCDVNPVCNRTFPRIQHALRYSLDPAQIKSNSINPHTNLLLPNSWPQRKQDLQTGGDVYTGTALIAGATLGIPASTPQPAGLDAICAGAFWTMQHYPLFFRDVALGGLHLTVDQVADVSPYVTSLRGCLPRLVALLRPLRNQHIGGQSFRQSPINGPGPRTDSGPPLLASLGRIGGSTVTSNSFTFMHPAMVAGERNTIAVRDANAVTVTATSNAFAVIPGINILRH